MKMLAGLYKIPDMMPNPRQYGSYHTEAASNQCKNQEIAGL